MWYTVAEVAVMLRYSLTKTKHLVLSGQIRSIKDGGAGASSPNTSRSTSPGKHRRQISGQAREQRRVPVQVR